MTPATLTRLAEACHVRILATHRVAGLGVLDPETAHLLDDMYVLAARHPDWERVCLTCHESFVLDQPGHSGRFCTAACRDRANRRPISLATFLAVTEAHRAGVTYGTLAELYGVSTATIWRWLKRPPA